MKPTYLDDFEDDVAHRAKCNPQEPPLIGRLVALRVAMNHYFGAQEFAPFDHELAQIEKALMEGQ